MRLLLYLIQSLFHPQNKIPCLGLLVNRVERIGSHPTEIIEITGNPEINIVHVGIAVAREIPENPVMMIGKLYLIDQGSDRLVIASMIFQPKIHPQLSLLCDGPIHYPMDLIKSHPWFVTISAITFVHHMM